MSDSPKKRGRPPKSKQPEVVQAGNILEQLASLSEDQKRILLESLNTQLNIQPLKEQVKGRQAKFTKNTFVDNKTQCKEDLEFNRQVKASVSERSREPAGKTKKCTRCDKQFMAYFSEFLCNTCATNG